MPTIRPILDESSRREFETPPVFETLQRRSFFTLPGWAVNMLKNLGSPTNQVMFCLQVGYFKASGRFFSPGSFHNKDIESVCRRFKIKRDTVSIEYFAKATRFRYQELILRGFGILPFDNQVQELCSQEIHHLVRKQIKSHLVFGAIASFIREHYFEVPSYFVLSAMINQAKETYEQELQVALVQASNPEIEKCLKGLFEYYLPDNDQPIHRNTPFQLTQLRTTQELMKVKVIRENVADFKYLKERYQGVLPLLQTLNLSPNFVEELALQVLRSRTFQVRRWTNRNLYLLCFIQYQYFYMTDILTQTFINAVEQNINLSEKTYKLNRQQEQEANLGQIHTVLESYLLQAEVIEKMLSVVLGFSHTQEEKLKIIAQGLSETATADFLKLSPLVKQLYAQTTRQTQDGDYYVAITNGSQKMQGKVGDLLRYLPFSAPTALQEAIDFYQKKEGNLTQNQSFNMLPQTFLKPNERKALLDTQGKLNVSLYKSLLARHLCKGLKSGAVYLNTSHEFKALDEYMIDPITWKDNQLSLMERANLTTIQEWDFVKERLDLDLQGWFNHTFDRINNGENLWVEKRKDGTLRFKVPKKEDDSSENDVTFYPTDRYITLFEALQTVNQVCNFTNKMSSVRLQNGRVKPDDKLFFAALMAYGCNLGVDRMLKTTKHISENNLEAIINNYMTVNNLQKANDTIIDLMSKMSIHKLYKKQSSITHTSSDGQKFDLLYDSIHANYSYKYFGKDKGITLYSFISDAHQVFHGLAFSASDREAWYVLNGLMHNQVVESDIHSTDTHGSTDIVFALCYLLGIDFQPRIKEFHLLKLHGTKDLSIENQQDYIINSGATINTKIIEEQWDNILRLVVSMKLKYTVPSQILKRLSSYALQNPLYQALKELGKLVRTIFLLRYMDDETMRQRIHQQLVKGESFNSLSSAIHYGNSGKIIYASKEDLLLLEGSKRLLENVVICWNYLYLTRSLVKATPQERKEIISQIPEISPVAWEHFNFQGEFDFDESAERDALELDIQEMYEFQWNEDELT